MLTDKREGLVVDVRLLPADGTWEREAALEMLASARGTGWITLVGDRSYETGGFVRECRKVMMTLHIAKQQCSGIDWRTTRHDRRRLSERGR